MKISPRTYVEQPVITWCANTIHKYWPVTQQQIITLKGFDFHN